MKNYLVRYEIITHDADDFVREERRLSAKDDEQAKSQARQIVDERRHEIECRGGACNTQALQVFRVEYRLIS